MENRRIYPGLKFQEGDEFPSFEFNRLMSDFASETANPRTNLAEAISSSHSEKITARIIGRSELLAHSQIIYDWVETVRESNGFPRDLLPTRLGNANSHGAIEESGNPYVPVDGSVIADLRLSEGGEYYIFSYPHNGVFFGEILTETGFGGYTFKEVYPEVGYTWEDNPWGVTNGLAEHVRGLTGIPVGTIVTIRRSYGETAPQIFTSRSAVVFPDGQAARDKHKVYIVGATSGTFTLRHTYNQTDAVTGDLAWNISAANLKVALEALANITTVTVTGAGTLADPWEIQYEDDFNEHLILIGSGRRFVPPLVQTLKGVQEYIITEGLPGITVQELDANPSLTAVTKLSFDQDDAFVVSLVAAGHAKVKLNDADLGIPGIVSVGSQILDGYKEVTGGANIQASGLPGALASTGDNYLALYNNALFPSAPCSRFSASVLGGATWEHDMNLFGEDISPTSLRIFDLECRLAGVISNSGFPLYTPTHGDASYSVFGADGLTHTGVWGNVSGLEVSGGLITGGSVSSGMSIGGPVSGGTNGSVLYVDGAGNLAQNNGSFNFDGTALTLGNTSLHVKDTDGTHELLLVPSSNLTADRSLFFATGDSNRTLTFEADAIVSQDYSTDGTVQFANLTLNNTGLKIKDSDGSHSITLELNTNHTADHTLRINTGDAHRTLSFAADFSLIASTTPADTTVIRMPNTSVDITLPPSGTLSTLTGVETLTNKTLTTPTIGSFTNANHSHTNAAGGGTLNASAIAAGTMATARLGSGVADATTFLRGDSTWTTPAGSGDVSAAANLTDNAIVRGDGGAKGVQTSGLIIDDSNHLTGLASITFPNTGLHILDTNATHDLILAPSSDLTADRTLFIATGDSNRTLTISADSTISGTNTGDQFTSVTASRLLGRGDSGAGVAQEIVLGSGLAMTGTTLSSSGGYTTENAQDDVAGLDTESETIRPVYTDATPAYEHHVVNSQGVCGRLTTESGVPISGTDRTAQTVLYYTSMGKGFGRSVPIWDGTRFMPRTLTAELTLTVNVAAATASTLYRPILYWSGAAVVLDLMPATGAIEDYRGYKVNSGAVTTTINGAVLAAKEALVLGLAYLDVDKKLTDTASKRYLINNYNKVPRRLYTCPGYNNDNAATSQSFNSNSAYIQVNGGNSSTVEFLVTDAMEADCTLYLTASVDNNLQLRGAISVDGNTDIVSHCCISVAGAAGASVLNSAAAAASRSFTVDQFHTFRFLAATASATNVLIWWDLQRWGATADPPASYLLGRVWG